MEKYQFWETTNVRFIRDIIKEDDLIKFLYPHAIPDNFKINLDEVYNPDLTIYSMCVYAEKAGIALFKRINGEHWVDVGFKKKFRGSDAVKLAKLTLKGYINKYTPQVIKAKIRKDNCRSLVFATWLKFKIIHQDDDFYYMELPEWEQ